MCVYYKFRIRDDPQSDSLCSHLVPSESCTAIAFKFLNRILVTLESVLTVKFLGGNLNMGLALVTRRERSVGCGQIPIPIEFPELTSLFALICEGRRCCEF